MDNLPILYQNIMDGLRTERGKAAFLWATDQRENDRLCYTAEKFAHEVDRLETELHPMLKMTEFGETGDLWEFIMKRHAGLRFGNNLKTIHTIKQGSEIMDNLNSANP